MNGRRSVEVGGGLTLVARQTYHIRQTKDAHAWYCNRYIQDSDQASYKSCYACNNNDGSRETVAGAMRRGVARVLADVKVAC